LYLPCYRIPCHAASLTLLLELAQELGTNETSPTGEL